MAGMPTPGWGAARAAGRATCSGLRQIRRPHAHRADQV